MINPGARKTQGRKRNASFRFPAAGERFAPAEILSAGAVMVVVLGVLTRLMRSLIVFHGFLDLRASGFRRQRTKDHRILGLEKRVHHFLGKRLVCWQVKLNSR